MWASLALFALLSLGLLFQAQRTENPEAVQTVLQPSVEQPPVPAPAPAPAPERAPERQQPVFDAAALEDRLRRIASEHGGVYGVVVFDPDSDQTAAINADETFGAASIGKLPALMSLYQAAARGEVDMEDEISILPSDVQAYGSGVLHTYPVGSTVTLRECAYFMVNKSDNTAWVMLNRYLGEVRIGAELYSAGARSTGYWDPNTTTPNDVLLMLRSIADPAFTSEELSSEMLAAMTGTHLEDRIPAGLPPGVRVAHKTGSYIDSVGDAGIVFYKDRDGAEKHYFIVVLAGGTDEATARHAMQEMSRASYEALAEPGLADPETAASLRPR